MELERLVGFERLGNNPNDFTIEALEEFLISKRVISSKAINFGSIRDRKVEVDSDDDWD